jgi:hypothetical protein
MNEVNQLASAMLAVAFAAGMLVAGQLYMQTKSNRLSAADPTRIGVIAARRSSTILHFSRAWLRAGAARDKTAGPP